MLDFIFTLRPCQAHVKALILLKFYFHNFNEVMTFTVILFTYDIMWLSWHTVIRFWIKSYLYYLLIVWLLMTIWFIMNFQMDKNTYQFKWDSFIIIFTIKSTSALRFLHEYD